MKQIQYTIESSSHGSDLSGVFELEQRRKDGSTVWTETRTATMRDEGGCFRGIIGVSRDISERKEAEIKLKKYSEDLAELNATKDKFFSIIAHDLRGPIGTFPRAIEMLERKPELSEGTRVLLGHMKESAESSYLLLENLLTWARSQRGDISFDPSDWLLATVIQNCMNTLSTAAHEKNIQVKISGDPDIKITADYNMIVTVIRNLLSNAIKFTPDGGLLEIISEKKDRFAEISVKDTGIGISPEKLSKMFSVAEKNISAKGTHGETGTGLGLILCQEFVKKHGGTISVTSEEKAGSVFTFTVPLAP